MVKTCISDPFVLQCRYSRLNINFNVMYTHLNMLNLLPKCAHYLHHLDIYFEKSPNHVKGGTSWVPPPWALRSRTQIAYFLLKHDFVLSELTVLVLKIFIFLNLYDCYNYDCMKLYDCVYFVLRLQEEPPFGILFLKSHYTIPPLVASLPHH